MADDRLTSIGRYRIVFPRIWRHPGFRSLKPAAQTVTFYILTGPQTNRIGLFHFSPATAAEDLDVGAETFRERLADVCRTFNWHFDVDARLFYIPSWWRWNRPANANVLVGNMKDLNEIAFSPLVRAFVHNVETLPETLRQTFVEGCAIRLGEPSPTQEQDQELVPISKQEQRAARGNEGRNVPGAIQAIATEVLREFSSADLDVIIDHVQYLGNEKKIKIARTAALEAIVAVRTSSGHRGAVV